LDDTVKTYYDVWQERLLKDGDAPFLITDREIVTYKQVWNNINILARRLANIGVKENMLTALRCKEDYHTIQLLLALMLIGAPAAPLNRYYGNSEIQEILKGNPYSFFIGDGNLGIDDIKKVSYKMIFDKWHIVEEFPFAARNAQEPATIIYSSGTTSASKAVVHSFSNHYFSALGSNENIKFTEGDSWLLSLPLYHIAGMSILFRAFVSGASVVVRRAGEALKFLSDDERITHISLVEAQLIEMLEDKSLSARMAKLKAILIGGGAVSNRLADEARKKGWPIYRTYGSTEMCSQVTTTSLKNSSKELHSSGRALPFRELKIAENGEILLRGKTLSLGYLKEGRLQAICDKEGWFHSADIGRVDSSALLHVEGRLDNMFISGGENIYPEAVERVIKRLPNIKKAVIVPVKHKKYGFRPALFLEMRKGGIPSIGALREMLKEKIAVYMMPDYVFPLQGEQQHGGIKVNRGRLKKKAQELVNSYGDKSDKR
jgi:O-succinylbenzoic acid--CoA ligase